MRKSTVEALEAVWRHRTERVPVTRGTVYLHHCTCWCEGGTYGLVSLHDIRKWYYKDKEYRKGWNIP